MNKILTSCMYWFMSFDEPATWIYDQRSKSVLDVGCGEGLPMRLLKKRFHIPKTVGVDLFLKYIDYCKAQHIHDSYVKKDVRKITFSNKSFDTVICLQVVEHLTKKEAWDMVKKFEKIAKRQIIISTPIGHLDHDEVDGNHLQLHKCFFYPEDFEKKGYTVIKTGRKGLYGNNGLVHKLPSPLHRLVFVLDVLLVPFYRALPNFGNYHFYAYKNLVNK